MTFSIYVLDLSAGFSARAEMILIGPFESAAARDAEVDRLVDLPNAEGRYEFVPSSLPAAAGDLVAHPVAVAAIQDARDLATVITPGVRR